MQHILNLADHFKAELGLEVIVEPSRSQSAAHCRLVPGELNLSDTGQAGGQTDIPYSAGVKITFSLRLLGANEQHVFTAQAMGYAIRLAELLKESFALPQIEEEALIPGLSIRGQALVHEAQRTQAGFHRLPEGEEDKEGRLFLYREDWTMTLMVTVIRDHNPPVLPPVVPTLKDET